jgi:NADH:ubiquinone oxidoreductase subunit E
MDKRNISVVSAGTAADHVRLGILNFSFWDWRRNEARLKQAGRGGVGTVFRQKKLTALVVKTKEVLPTWNISLNKVTDWTTSQIEPKRETPRKLVREIIQKWRADPDYVIEMMQDIQERERYLSQSALQELSLRIGVPESQLYHIATFYKAFSLKPRGEIVVQVCVGTACHVKGSEKILSSFERILKCQRGETTQDRRFSLEAVGCLGACAIAPVVKIGDEIIGGVQSRDVGRLIQRAKKRLEERKIQQRIRQGGSHA